jgi:outer membrane protein insertion porin family
MRAAVVLGIVCCARAHAAPPPAEPEPEPPAADEPTVPIEPDVEPEPASTEPEEPEDDPASDDELGPLLLIERIDVEGNTNTQAHVIRRALPIQAGDALRASDPRITTSRFKVLALGYFRDVKLKLAKGSARGQVVLVVSVVERGTLALNRLWFGSNSLSPYWFGADVSERNLGGIGVMVGGGLIYADYGDVDGGRAQYAGELRLAVPGLGGSRVGINGSFTGVHGAEAFRLAGRGGTDPELDELGAFTYRRLGGRVGFTYDVTALTRLSGGLRSEQIKAATPLVPTRTFPDGTIAPIDLHLQPGTSHVTTLAFGYDRDTRPDPVLSHSGMHLAAAVELGALASDYRFATLFGRFEQFWPLWNDHHALALKLAGGVVAGDAPRFDRIHLGDVDHMVTPRALGLVLSSAEPFDLLGTRRGKPSYGDLGGYVTVEYARTLFRGKGKARVYGSDLFVGAGLWGLAETSDLRARDTSLWNALPIDVYVDAGVRLDTDIGIFELTIANALGRLR